MISVMWGIQKHYAHRKREWYGHFHIIEWRVCGRVGEGGGAMASRIKSLNETKGTNVNDFL